MKVENRLDPYISELKKLPTPFYFYEMDLLEKTLIKASEVSKKYKYHIHYALKANVNEKLLKRLIANNFGADCVSGNEIKRAIDAGLNPANIAFAGVGKTDSEINFALENDIFCFNVESIQELEVINELANNKNKIASIALRINPNVNTNTHEYITTGLEENKFGINFWELTEVCSKLKTLKNLNLLGLHFHVGSQITDMSVFKNLCTRINEFQLYFAERNFKFSIVNVGGGLGIDYYSPEKNSIPDFEEYFSIFDQFLTKYPGQSVHFELGRSLIAQCGTLISSITFIKKGLKTNFAILDAGMTELLRPALYQAYHKIENISSDSEKQILYDVVGPVCESSDCFGKAVLMPESFRNDLIAIYSTGAYGEVMASRYNLREETRSFYSDEMVLK